MTKWERIEKMAVDLVIEALENKLKGTESVFVKNLVIAAGIAHDKNRRAQQDYMADYY